MEKGAGHQEEMRELKQRPWLGVGNSGNSPRGGPLKMEKRTLIVYRAGCTLNSWEEEKPHSKAKRDELETLKGQESVRETRGRRTVQEGGCGLNVRDLQRGKMGLG